MRPLDDHGFDELSTWIRKRYMKNIRKVSEILTKAERDAVICRTATEVAVMSSRTEEGLRVLFESVHGYAGLVYGLLDNPDMTFEEFDELLFGEENYSDGLSAVNDMFYAIYGKLFSDVMTDAFSGSLFNVANSNGVEKGEPEKGKQENGEAVKGWWTFASGLLNGRAPWMCPRLVFFLGG